MQAFGRSRRECDGARPATTVIHVAAVAQLVECVLGKDEVMGSIPISSFWNKSEPIGIDFIGGRIGAVMRSVVRKVR